MQDDQLLADIGPEVLNGNAALWLGPAWQIPETNIAMRMSGLSWLAIWSESNGAEFASLLKDAWSRSERLRKRVVVEVAGRMSDALGSYYALSEVCPFFISVGERTRGIRCRRERRRARSWRAPPWRAFANDVQWKRDPRFISSVLASLRDALKGSAPAVTCVNLGAESGSGLTTFLMEVAFRLAQSGYPTLIAKPELRRIDYELLRTFLEHLSVGQSEVTPAVLVFDDSERGLDAPTGIQDTVLRLAKDGRHVLIFRGAIIRAGEEVTRDLQQSKAILLVRESE